jgi:hypothetical protein
MDNSFETGFLLTLLRTPPLMGYALTIQEVYCFAKLYFRIASELDFVHLSQFASQLIGSETHILFVMKG